MIKDKGKKFLSELKLHTDYLKWDANKNKVETYSEAVDKILDTHYSHLISSTKLSEQSIIELLDSVRPYLKNKEFLASQRSLQYRGDQIHAHHARLYNCCTTYAYSPDVFSKGFYVLLCGTGLGVSLRKKFVSQLPIIHKKNNPDTVYYVIEDSIEGWADAVKVLLSSFLNHPSLIAEYFNKNIVFDASKIRPKGSFISGGFKAPGPDGLIQSLSRITRLLDANPGEFKSIIAYDIFMHLSDAVLSGGVRRSAMNVLIDYDDEEMKNAKIGNWRQDHPYRARSNNSVGLYRNQFTESQFKELLALNQGDNDLGFAFTSSEDDIFNPCFEIGFNFYDKIQDKNEAAFQFCNLNEINATACVYSDGSFSAYKFYELCKAAATLGTIQASYTKFPYLGKQTEEIVKGEALLGVSITGWMDNPELFNSEVLQCGANFVKAINKKVSNAIGINQSARTTTVKPSGNASAILGTSSGIHPDHSKRYFRVMQLNKNSETAKYISEKMPEMLEESKWSATNSDYVIYIPCELNKNALIKEEVTGVKHLELIKMVQENWVAYGKNKDLCYHPDINHNVSNTVIIDDLNEITEYIYKNQDSFAAVSFISAFGDKDYTQAPFTSVLTTEELFEKYGDGFVFMSGLIVDGLHYFQDDLWKAVSFVENSNVKLFGTRENVLLQTDWIRRVKKYAKNYFGGDLVKTIYCMKDVYLFHKWNVISRVFKDIDFNKILTQPNYTDVSKNAAIACSGGSCEI